MQPIQLARLETLIKETYEGDLWQNTWTCWWTYLTTDTKKTLVNWFPAMVFKINNGLETVKVNQFKALCEDTNRLIMSSFDNHTRWINISPTLPALLAYSWELIQSNGDCGLGAYTESSLENRNKFLPFYRQFLNRKRDEWSDFKSHRHIFTTVAQEWPKNKGSSTEAGMLPVFHNWTLYCFMPIKIKLDWKWACCFKLCWPLS